MHKMIPDSYSKREGGNPGNSGLSSQEQTDGSTVWKNSYAEHKVTGKTYNPNKTKEEVEVRSFAWIRGSSEVKL